MTKVNKSFIYNLIAQLSVDEVCFLLQKDKEVFIYEISDDKRYIEVDEFIVATLLNVNKNYVNIIFED